MYDYHVTEYRVERECWILTTYLMSWRDYLSLMYP